MYIFLYIFMFAVASLKYHAKRNGIIFLRGMAYIYGYFFR